MSTACDGYDFAAHGWDRGGSMNPKLIDEYVERLRKVAADPERWQATTDGGWPRCGWGDVHAVAMHQPRHSISPCRLTTNGVNSR